MIRVPAAVSSIVSPVLELVADGVGQIPVLGGAGFGAGLENLGSGLVHVVTRIGDQTGGNA